MTPQAVLIDLLERVGASKGAAILVNDVELSQWPSVAVKVMKSQKLIVKARPSCSVVCPGCERDCVMPVHTLPVSIGAPTSFIVCDKRSDTNRVPVSTERLVQWQCNIDLVCSFVTVCLGLRRNNKRPTSNDLSEIGIVSGNKRSQMICLKTTEGLTLITGNTKVPLAELIEYHDGAYSLNMVMLHVMVDAATTADKRYTPSAVKREARKLDTQSLHESWKKAYHTLKKKRRDMSDVWYSQQIAKMDIAHGRNAETIRKNMKK